MLPVLQYIFLSEYPNQSLPCHLKTSNMFSFHVVFDLCFLECQSAMNRSSPGLYISLTLYWCILSKIHCILCDNIATSF